MSVGSKCKITMCRGEGGKEPSVFLQQYFAVALQHLRRKAQHRTYTSLYNHLEDNICETIMDDSRDTVIMRVPDEQLEGEDFIKFFSKPGVIKTGGNTGQRMALMRLIKDKMTGINMHEGIVTYENPGAAEKAVKTLNGKSLNGHRVIVQGAEDFFIESHEKPVVKEDKNILDSRSRDDNTAWRYWLKADRQIIARGGRGGKPAVSGGVLGWFGWGSKGRDGEAGEPGPHGGRGGEGGKGQG